MLLKYFLFILKTVLFSFKYKIIKTQK